MAHISLGNTIPIGATVQLLCRHGLDIFLVLASIGLALADANSSCSPASSDSLIVQTTSGRVHGFINEPTSNVRQFRGIPFAQPPVGQLRWLPPQPLASTAALSDIHATTWGPSCPQIIATSASIWTVDTPQFDVTGTLSEDCLSLSVYAPQKLADTDNGDGLLPVMVWMYGGGMITGGQHVLYFDPSHWIQRTPELLVVTINYRVNIFGFPFAEGLDDQNVGLMDQRAAVEWVRDNIAQFGGDPDRIGLWGQSAGSASVDWYNYAYPEDPIVSSLFMDSGTAPLPGASGTYGNFTYLASQFGCGNLTAQARLDCMREVPWQIIEDTLNSSTTKLVFYPVPDEKLYFSNYSERAAQGLMAKIPAIIGNTLEEGNALVFPFNASGVNATLSKSETFENFFCPATTTVRWRTALGLPSFRFIYAGNFTSVSPRPWEGAYHCSELPLIFGSYMQYNTEREPGGIAPTLMNETSHAMQDAYLALLRGGAGALTDETGWEPYTVGSDYARLFGQGLAVQNWNISFMEEQCIGVEYKYFISGTGAGNES